MKTIKVIIIAVIAVLICSCSNKEIEEEIVPIFKVTSFNKVLVDGIYRCSATILITNIPEEYSIDGIIYSEEVPLISTNLSYSEDMLYDIHKRDEGEFYFNIYGKHQGTLILDIQFKSKEDLRNYLIGWHLTYGFGANCKVLMVDLDTQIINK